MFDTTAKIKNREIVIKDIKNAVIISPHPDDETLGVGALSKISKNGTNVSVLVVSGITTIIQCKCFSNN